MLDYLHNYYKLLTNPTAVLAKVIRLQTGTHGLTTWPKETLPIPPFICLFDVNQLISNKCVNAGHNRQLKNMTDKEVEDLLFEEAMTHHNQSVNKLRVKVLVSVPRTTADRSVGLNAVQHVNLLP